MPKHIVSLSGGIGSYAVLKRVLSANPKEDVVAVFCDTCMEDPDLYRFLKDIELHFDLNIIRLIDGRTPWGVAYHDNFVFNSRVANCSKVLKSRIFTHWLKQTQQKDAVLYFGIDFTESHRCGAIQKNYSGYVCKFPLCDKPYFYKNELLDQLNSDGIKTPRLYNLGFTHNNCGGFCFKAGMGHFRNLLKVDPDLYRYHEHQEQKLIHIIGKNVGILKRKGQPLTLMQLRLLVETEQMTNDEINDIGGCGCFVDTDEE